MSNAVIKSSYVVVLFFLVAILNTCSDGSGRPPGDAGGADAASDARITDARGDTGVLADGPAGDAALQPDGGGKPKSPLAGLDPTYKPWTPPASAVHIDPTNSGDPSEDGSKAHPFDSIKDISWKDNTVYVIRRGTTIKAEAFTISGSGITLASYGAGARPVLQCTSVAAGSNKHAIRVDSGKDLAFRDIDIYGPKATSLIRIGGSSSKNIKIIGCKLRGAGWGLRAFDLTGLLVDNTEVTEIMEDGMFIQGVTDIEIRNCHVHKINQNWVPPYTPQSKAGGDAVQLSNSNKWHVHHNLLDRTNSGNKFCFISNNPNQNDGVFEYNVNRGPLTTGDGGSSIYLQDGTGIIVRYNRIYGPAPSGLYSHGKDLKIYGNVFAGTSGGVHASASATITNNVFYGQKSAALSGGAITAANNIFDPAAGVGSPFGKISKLTESHNLLTQGTPSAGSFSGKPAFVDPTKLDFHLQKGSMCIDRGKAVGHKKDMDGTTVPRGKGPDVGAFEFSP